MENQMDLSMYGYENERKPLKETLGNYWNSVKDFYKRYWINEKNEVGHRFIRAGYAGVIGIYALLGIINPIFFLPMIIGLYAVLRLSRPKKHKD